jgi:hypothetical protein
MTPKPPKKELAKMKKKGFIWEKVRYHPIGKIRNGKGPKYD